ncbi:unnamed protein product, partial [Musa textilis]
DSLGARRKVRWELVEKFIGSLSRSSSGVHRSSPRSSSRAHQEVHQSLSRRLL